MVVVPKFTPELLVSAPKRGPAIPNHDGTIAVFSQSTHEIGGTTMKEHRILHIKTGKTEHLLTDDKAKDLVWLGHGTNNLLYLSQGDRGYTWVKTVDAGNPSASPVIVDFIEAPVSCLKVKALKNGSVAFVVAGLADQNENLYNEETDKRPHTARVTEDWNPRIWDSYTKPQKYVLFYTDLVQEDGDWKLNKPLKNALAGSTLTSPPFMYEPITHIDDFDVSDDGIVFAATEHNISDPKKARLSDIYYLPLRSFSEASRQGLSKILLQVDIHPQSRMGQGYCRRPRFSPGGSMIAFLRAAAERDLDESVWVKHVESPSAIDVFSMVTGKEWNLVPDGYEFTADGHALYLQAADTGKRALYKLALLPNAYPQPIIRSGSVSAYFQLQQGQDANGKLLVSSSSLVEPWIYQIIDTDIAVESDPWVISKASQVTNLGLSSTQVSEVYFEGTGDYVVHAWVITPRDFKPEENKYPLCLQVHGGPNGSWNDEWSTWWNLAAWAEQGFIVVAPNITGSQGFGLDMAEVRDNWGGQPYDDLVNCLEYIKHMPGIDMENAVALGGSWGGYMMNWIQGHELGRRFKALVCHDGMFHLPTYLLGTDALPKLFGDFGGPPFSWRNLDGMERYNPARSDLLKHWKTPMLIIHSDMDYRCPITDGLAAFHTLKAQGTPARFLSFPDENHIISKEENMLEWYRQVFAWLDKWSGVAPRTRNV